MNSFKKTLLDAGEFWCGCGRIHNTLRHLGSILDLVGIPYAVFGRAAQFAHGFEQYNLDTDVIVVTAEGFEKMQRSLPARGFTMISERRFRDSLTDLEFKVILSGRLAGPEPCPVRFPDPSASVMIHGYRVVDLPRFIDLKLAIGLWETRMRDLADVLQLIQHAALPRELVNDLHPYVRDEYERIWLLAQMHDPFFD
ncbi:MAG: hypothetical protein QOI58_474 [Thermoanaerobaculia bacterium]|jgi:hypothetical protein|nr:hypothetical protein [Thermoanaerobaculia bacterium]